MISYRVQGQSPAIVDNRPTDAQLWETLVGLRAGVAVADLNWNIIATNRAWRQKTASSGLEAHLEPGQNYRTFCLKFFTQSIVLHSYLRALRAIEAGGAQHIRHAFELPDGSCTEMAVDLLEVGTDRFVTLTLLDLEEVVELRRQHVMLDESLQQARQLLIQVQDQERRNVARELHDSAGQYLTALSLVLARMRQMESHPEMSDMVLEMSELIGCFHQQIRGITYLLHPPELEEAGLAHALFALCSGLKKRTGLKIDLTVQGEEHAFPDRAEAVVYRVVQEALTNVLRHAQAQFVRVRVCLRPDAIILVVRDDGIGLRGKCDADNRDDLVLGVGIAGMTARVCKLGGRLLLRDRHDRLGTVVAAIVPRPEEEPGPHAAGAAALSRLLLDRFAH